MTCNIKDYSISTQSKNEAYPMLCKGEKKGHNILTKNQYSASLGPTEEMMHYATDVRRQRLPKDTKVKSNANEIMGEYELNKTCYPIAPIHSSEQGENQRHTPFAPPIKLPRELV